MGALKNLRWEKFCKSVGRGEHGSNAAAYVAAGFKCSPKVAKINAHKLMQRPEIQARISEIREELDEATSEARAAAIEQAGLTRELIINELLDNVKRAKDKKRFDGATANRALELLGKELGMFIDRSENTNTIYGISDRPLTPQEWADKYANNEVPENAGPAKKDRLN